MKINIPVIGTHFDVAENKYCVKDILQFDLLFVAVLVASLPFTRRNIFKIVH
jgi:hypothetical protein